MPSANRIAPGGWLFHVLNRGNARMEVFEKDADYQAFEVLLGETLERFAMRLLAYCHAFTHQNELDHPCRRSIARVQRR